MSQQYLGITMTPYLWALLVISEIYILYQLPPVILFTFQTVTPINRDGVMNLT